MSALSVSEVPDSASAEFQKGYESDLWRFMLSNKWRTTTGWQLSLNQSSQLNLHRPQGYRRRWISEENISLGLTGPARGWSWQINTTLENYTEQRTDRITGAVPVGLSGPATFAQNQRHQQPAIEGGINSRNWFFGGGGKLNLTEGGYLELTVGPLQDHRNGVSQRGGRLTAAGGWGSGFQLTSDARIDDLPQGRDIYTNLVFNGSGNLSDEATDHIKITLNQSVQREVTLSNRTTNRRRDSYWSVTNRLNSIGPLRSCLEWVSRFNNRSSNRSVGAANYDDGELNWQNGLKTEFTTGRSVLIFDGGLDLQEQTFAGGQTQGRRSYMGFHANFSLSPIDSISAYARAARYRFDTPDEEDTNDRDELNYLAGFTGNIYILEGFNCKWALEADLKHLVYLFGERSIDNRWERQLLMRLGFPWHSERLKNRALFTVSSAYTDYDYAPADENLSRVYRYLSLMDSLSWQWNSRIATRISFQYLIDEHGRLNWREWVQDISESGTRLSSSMTQAFTLYEYDVIIGWHWNQRITYVNIIEGEYEGESITADGPLIQIHTPSFGKFRGELMFNQSRIRDVQRGKYRLTDLYCRLHWQL